MGISCSLEFTFVTMQKCYVYLVRVLVILKRHISIVLIEVFT